MKKTIILAALAALLAPVATAQDARYKLIRQEWTVQPDGTTDYHYRHEVQVLRNRALTAYAYLGETFVVYNPMLEEVTVNEVYTLRADGSRVDMPQNAFIDQLPEGCADCGRYNGLRELAMVHTGMELGCTVVVDYTIHRNYGIVNETLTLAKEAPVDRWEISVDLPDGQTLNVQEIKPEYGVAIATTAEQGTNFLHYAATSVPQNYREPNLPSDELLYTTLHFYNGSHQYLPADDGRALDEARATTDRIMNGRVNLKSIAALRDYVRDDVHLNAIDPIHLGYRRASASETFRSQCGTLADKALLLASMLRSEGVDAWLLDDQVELVAFRLDTLTYTIPVNGRMTATVLGKADEAVTTASVEAVLQPADYTLDTLADGFFCLRRQPMLAPLAPSRTAPLAVAPCNTRRDNTYILPKGMKMVQSKVERTVVKEGLGEASLSIVQKGNKLRVIESLKVEPSVVSANRYAEYRELIAPFMTATELILRAK